MFRLACSLKIVQYTPRLNAPIIRPFVFRQMSSLCFYDAAVKRKSNEISEDVYLQSIAAHATGLRHGRNKLCNGDSKPAHFDSEDTSNYIYFASNVRSIDSFASYMASCLQEFDAVEGIYAAQRSRFLDQPKY